MAARSKPTESRRQEQLLREAVRSILHEEAITVGKVRAALAAAKKAKSIERAKELAKAGGKVAVSAILDQIPVLGNVKKGFERGMELKDLYDAYKSVDPEAKKKNPLIDLLTIDPDTSAIVDDAVEAEFFKALTGRVEYLDDEDELPDADQQLASWLKGEYKGAHVSK